MHCFALEPPPELAVHLDIAKEQMRVRHADDDMHIAGLIAAAVEHVEAITGRSLITRKWRLVTSTFQQCIQLPRPPVVAVESVSYLDTAGASQTLAEDSWRVAPLGLAGYFPTLFRQDGHGPFPETANTPDAVTIDFTAGYGPRWEMVPATLRHAIVMLVAHWYENREAVLVGQTQAHTVPLAFEQLLVPFCTLRVG